MVSPFQTTRRGDLGEGLMEFNLNLDSDEEIDRTKSPGTNF